MYQQRSSLHIRSAERLLILIRVPPLIERLIASCVRAASSLIEVGLAVEPCSLGRVFITLQGTTL